MTQPTQPNKPRAFQDREVQPARKNLALKLDNKKSMTEALPKPIDPAVGQKQVEEVNARLNNYAAEAAQLTLAFKKVVLDKTLPINKSILAKDAEHSLITNLIELGTAMNNDVREKEGIGAMGNIALLLGTLLVQRDRINELGYVVEQLERKVHALETQAKPVPIKVEPIVVANPDVSSGIDTANSGG